MSKKMELLAPAGSMHALRAAVCAGADAVYLGLDAFNARRGADNFTLETLGSACDYAHLRNVKVYLAFNTIVFQREVARALELVRQAYRAGVDAFIVQDIGLASELSRTLPSARLHISTQMNTHSVAGVEAAYSLGASRITLARELSLEQICALRERASELGMEIEVFGHGALCVCYSGQCYMSSLIGGRSANRGTCAQPCRLPYELRNASVRKALDAPGEHLLSPKDVCTIDMLDKLIDAQVASLKIEGRMKSAEYVFATTSVYRRVLDRCFAACEQGAGGVAGAGGAAGAGGSNTSDWRATHAERDMLAEAFSRGFTTGYLTHQRGNEIMSYQRPNNRGAFLGRVARVVKDAAFIQTEKELHETDVLEVWNKRGRSTFTLASLETTKDGYYRLPFLKGQKNTQFISQGDRVFRVRNASATFHAGEYEPRIPVDFMCELHLGKPAQLSVSVHDSADLVACEGAREGACKGVCVQGGVVERARTKSLTAAEVRDHINRLGQTPFEARSIEVVLDEGVGMSFSQLHHLRTQALEALRDTLLAPYCDRRLPRVEKISEPAPSKLEGYAIYVHATNPACARVAKRTGATCVYVPALTYKRGEGIIAGQINETAQQAGYPKQCVVQLPVLNYDQVPTTREAARSFNPWEYVKAHAPVLVENWGDVNRALACGARVEVGSHVPVVNRLSVDMLARRGVSRVWLSPELSLEHIQDLGQNRASVPLGITIIGRHELMTTEHCLLMSQGACTEQCSTCARRKSPHYVRDRKGFDFPVVTDALGRSHVYNSVEFDIAHTLPDLIAAGVTTFMVDASCMNVEQTAHAVGRAVHALSLARRDGNRVAKINGATTGHLFRSLE